MATKEKVCRECKLFVKGNVCPNCNKANFSRVWKGILIVNDPNGSEVAEFLDIKVPGKYCLWVK